MGHQDETPVPKEPYMLRRGNRYVFRIKIPAELRRARIFENRKDIKVPLKTSIISEARKRRAVELALWQDRFDQERAKLDLKPVSKFGTTHAGRAGDEFVKGEGAILGTAARKIVLHLSTAWGGCEKHNLLLDAILQWSPPTSPKFNPLDPINPTTCAF